MSQIAMTRCLVCGWYRPLERKGTDRILRGQTADRQYVFDYNHIDLEASPFISFREAQGRGKGFPQVGALTLRQALKDPEYKELIGGLKTQCYNILKMITEEESQEKQTGSPVVSEAS